jgi:hypothetical protein
MPAHRGLTGLRLIEKAQSRGQNGHYNNCFPNHFVTSF